MQHLEEEEEDTERMASVPVAGLEITYRFFFSFRRRHFIGFACCWLVWGIIIYDRVVFVDN